MILIQSMLLPLIKEIAIRNQIILYFLLKPPSLFFLERRLGTKKKKRKKERKNVITIEKIHYFIYIFEETRLGEISNQLNFLRAGLYSHPIIKYIKNLPHFTLKCIWLD